MAFGECEGVVAAEGDAGVALDEAFFKRGERDGELDGRAGLGTGAEREALVDHGEDAGRWTGRWRWQCRSCCRGPGWRRARTVGSSPVVMSPRVRLSAKLLAVSVRRSGGRGGLLCGWWCGVDAAGGGGGAGLAVDCFGFGCCVGGCGLFAARLCAAAAAGAGGEGGEEKEEDGKNLFMTLFPFVGGAVCSTWCGGRC